MELNLDKGSGIHIRSYETGRIQTDETTYSTSIIISSQKIAIWRPLTFADLTEEDVMQLIPLNPKVVLIGTGPKLHLAPPTLFRCLIEKRIGYEVMDTAAACRTYNVLMTENRAVVAGLLVS